MKHIRLKPDDPEPYYWIGVIDWSLAFRGNKDMRDDYNNKGKKTMKDTDPLPPDVAKQFAAKYGPIVDEGIDQLAEGHRASSPITTTPWLT